MALERSGKSSWTSWVVSEPERRTIERNGIAEATDWFVTITCPHCNDTFEATAKSVRTNKSYLCKAHLARSKCNLPEADRGGVDTAIAALPPSKRVRMSVVQHAGCVKRYNDLKEEMTSRFERLESDRDNLVRAMVTAFPSLVKPITETNVVPQIKLLITNEAKSTVPTVASALRYV